MRDRPKKGKGHERKQRESGKRQGTLKTKAEREPKASKGSEKSRDSEKKQTGLKWIR